MERDDTICKQRLTRMMRLGMTSSLEGTRGCTNTINASIGKLPKQIFEHQSLSLRRGRRTPKTESEVGGAQESGES